MKTLISLLCLLLLTTTAFAAAPNIEMVRVPGGCFQMGDTFGDGNSDEKPVHEVCVSDFYIGKYLVTQAQWVTVMGENPSKFTGDRRPVDTVSWDDAQEFIKKLNQQSGRSYRLPTEAEWEYAARSGGRKEKWAGTSDPSQLGDYAWYKENSDEKTHVVGTKKPNGLGLYDMSGNLWQWCQDKYGDVYYEESDRNNPQGPLTGSARVVRGGSWYNSAGNVRASYRHGGAPGLRYDYGGFRLGLPAVQ
jgi:formylglycine-generating enzyme required for sulfatase activity